MCELHICKASNKNSDMCIKNNNYMLEQIAV